MLDEIEKQRLRLRTLRYRTRIFVLCNAGVIIVLGSHLIRAHQWEESVLSMARIIQTQNETIDKQNHVLSDLKADVESHNRMFFKVATTLQKLVDTQHAQIVWNEHQAAYIRMEITRATMAPVPNGHGSWSLPTAETNGTR